jgi:hypothetical protein
LCAPARRAARVRAQRDGDRREPARAGRQPCPRATRQDAAGWREHGAGAARFDGGEPALYRNVGYDTLKDFEHIALVADLPLLLVANPSLPVKTLPELIAYAKANPDKLAHPSSGIGTLSHLGMEDLKRRAGIAILHVPYQGYLRNFSRPARPWRPKLTSRSRGPAASLPLHG